MKNQLAWLIYWRFNPDALAYRLLYMVRREATTKNIQGEYSYLNSNKKRLTVLVGWKNNYLLVFLDGPSKYLSKNFVFVQSKAYNEKSSMDVLPQE